MSVTNIIDIHFATKRDNFNMKEQWLSQRVNLFKKTTLKSILNQEFKQFRIWLYCSPEFRRSIEKLIWHPRIEIHYDLGKKALKKIDSDFISLSRVDSDDLLHQRAMKVITASFKPAAVRTCLTFRRLLIWDVMNGFIGSMYLQANTFFTHIFPKAIYNDFHKYSSLHFVPFGKAGGRQRDSVTLRHHMACIVRHSSNMSLRRLCDDKILSDDKRIRIGGRRLRFGEKARAKAEAEMKTDIFTHLSLGETEILTFKKEDIVGILKPFGISKSQISRGGF